MIKWKQSGRGISSRAPACNLSPGLRSRGEGGRKRKGRDREKGKIIPFHLSPPPFPPLLYRIGEDRKNRKKGERASLLPSSVIHGPSRGKDLRTEKKKNFTVIERGEANHGVRQEKKEQGSKEGKDTRDFP